MRWRMLLITLAWTVPWSSASGNDVFVECDHCPEMVMLPAGTFTMGAEVPSGDAPHRSWGGPPVGIIFDRPFAIAQTEVTVAQWRAFTSATGYEPAAACRSVWDTAPPTWRDPRWPDTHSNPDDHPVVCVGFEDVLAYVAWLNGRARGDFVYALPSEAEFEYASRAGDTGETPWADPPQACRYANVADRHFAATPSTLPSIDCDDGFASTSPVGSFPANRFGLHDMLGNVWEWIADCSSDDYTTLPPDGSPRAGSAADCTSGRQTRGGSFVSSGPWLDYSARGGLHPVPGSNHVALGFRVVAHRAEQQQ